MEWDEEAARTAVDEFNGLFKQLQSEFPECMRTLSAAWRDGYIKCGHRRLGRIVLGYTPEDACKVMAKKA